MDPELFQMLLEEMKRGERSLNGIGTLKEKSVHALLKNYLAPDQLMHEIKISGYVADVFTGSRIYEIQTGNFDKLRQKLDTFLPLFPVTIVYPVYRNKYLVWIDPETGECRPPRKSNRKGVTYDIFPELYKIKKYLESDHFSLKLIYLDVLEYRIMNGWSVDGKKGAQKDDRIPLEIVDEMDIIERKDYLKLLPNSLDSEFTVSDLSKNQKMNKKKIQTALHIMNYLGVVERIGKRGKEFLYRV